MTTTFSRKIRAAALALAIGATGTLASVESAGAADAVPATQSCVTGRLVHTYNLTREPVPGWSIRAWDADTGQANEPLGAGSVTDSAGRFRFCFSYFDYDKVQSAFGAMPVVSLQDVYVQATADSPASRTNFVKGEYVSSPDRTDAMRPRATGGFLSFRSRTISEVPAGTTADLGDIAVPTELNPVAYVAAQLAAVDQWLPKSPAGCRDRRDSVCPQRVVYFMGGTSLAIDPDVAMTLHGQYDYTTASIADREDLVSAINESVLMDVYEGLGPLDVPSCTGSGHCYLAAVNAAGDVQRAFGSGLVDWMTASILKTNRINGYDLESVNATTAGWATGNAVEGRVAAGLIDISDTTNEGGDKLGEGNRVPGKIWTTITDRLPLTFSDFVAKRAAGGFDTGANFDSTLAHNTLTR